MYKTNFPSGKRFKTKINHSIDFQVQIMLREVLIVPTTQLPLKIGGGLTLPFSFLLLNRIWVGGNKVKRLKDREIIYQLPSQANQTHLGEN